MNKLKIIKHKNTETEPTMWVVNWNEDRRYLIVCTIQQSIEYSQDCFFSGHPCSSYLIACAPNSTSAMRMARLFIEAWEAQNALPETSRTDFEVMEHTRELTRKAISVWEPPSRLVY